MTPELTKKYLTSNKIDFLDFGASKAASLEYGKNHFFGKKGLGLDLDKERVTAMKKAGYACVATDLTKVKLPGKSVRFVKMAHILEHMPDLKAVERCIKVGGAAATGFLVITGPYFDADEHLAIKGFKLHWSDYPDHPCHLKVSELVSILDRLKLSNYEIYLRYPIRDSSSEHVHPLASPRWAHKYEAGVHPPKKHFVFNQDAWTDFVCYVRLGQVKNWNEITRGYKNQIPFIEKANGVKRQWPADVIEKFIELDEINQREQDQIKKLKDRNVNLSNKIQELQNRLTGIISSKSWRTIRALQKGSFAAKSTRASLKIAKRKFKL